jgi:hypothetical protein
MTLKQVEVYAKKNGCIVEKSKRVYIVWSPAVQGMESECKTLVEVVQEIMEYKRMQDV